MYVNPTRGSLCGRQNLPAGACSRTRVFHEPTPRTGRGPGTVRTDAGRARDRPRSMHEARIDNGRTALPPTRRRERKGIRAGGMRTASAGADIGGGTAAGRAPPTCMRDIIGTGDTVPKYMRDQLANLIVRTRESTEVSHRSCTGAGEVAALPTSHTTGMASVPARERARKRADRACLIRYTRRVTVCPQAW